MLSQRYRVVIWAGAGLLGIWLVALAGWLISDQLKVTPAKVQAYVNSRDLGRLSAADRAKAIQTLAEMLNKLSLEERQELRADRMSYRWFEEMTEEEKGQFIEATMPTGFKQMISAFEQLPEEKRRRAIEDALNRLRNPNRRIGMKRFAPGQARGGEPISGELETKIRTIGLKTFYSQSSAQTKAELAPVIEELQRAMESGRMMRR